MQRYKDPDYMKKYHRLWYLKHREKVLARSMKWRKTHPRLAKKAQQRWRATNNTSLRQKKREYYERNREAIRIAHHGWYQANKTKRSFRRKRKQYANDHKARLTAYQQSYAQTNSERLRQYKKEYSAKNATKMKRWHSRYYLKNRERLRLDAKRRYWQKKELIKARVKEWQEKHPDKCREYRHKRWKSYSLEERKARQAWANHGRKELFHDIILKWRAASRLCYICGMYLKKSEICIEHVHPKKHGGSDNKRNLMPAHLACNSKKNCHLNFPVARPDLIEVANG